MDITTFSAGNLARLLSTREVTAREVLEAYRNRIEASDPAVNAFVTLDWEAAFAQAKQLDTLFSPWGPLHGVPVAIKDIFPTAGLRTTYGSRSFDTHVPDHDALHVARLRQAGAIIIGKTNTPEFAFSGQTANLVAGTTRNPLNTDLSVAGSSGGSAAALAAHQVALADGSDLGGSLRTPAAWCGVVGYRPTSGLIPLVPSTAPFDGLHVPGPMGRSVADVALMARVMAGNDPEAALGFWGAQIDSRSHEPGHATFSAAPFGADTDPSIRAALAPVPGILRDLGWQVTEDTFPPLDPLLPFVSIVRGLSALQVQAAMRPDMALAGESYTAACASGTGKSLRDLAEFQAAQAKCWQDTSRFFSQFDFALWPTSVGLPFSADLRDGEITEDWRTVTLTPMLELPGISIPCGRGADGLPVGLHITGPRGSDAALLSFAAMIEARLNEPI